MESTHPGYDEYRYQLDEIGHDPYQLISHLTAVYEQFTRGQVKPVIKELFKQQYLLKVWETIEIRTRMETRVGVRPTIDAFGNVSMETYTHQEEVEYEYKILNILLKNKGFDTIARKNMNRKQTGRYDAYNLTYGNRPELFGAGREKRIYAVPPFTRVESLDFDDHPFTVQQWDEPCAICGSTHSYLDEVVLDDAGNRMFVCSDTDYCRQQSEAKNQ